MQTVDISHVTLPADALATRSPEESSTQKILRSALALALFAGLIFGITNCADSNLVCVSADCKEKAAGSGLDNKVELKGDYCTADPNVVGLLYRILFIVDVSGSTAQSDPTNARGPAVQAAITQYANNPEVSFALMSFDTAPNILEPTFTNNTGILFPIIPQLNAVRGSTDYIDTLVAAQNLIAADANSLTVSQRARTQYEIQWLSDGVPNPCPGVGAIDAAEQDILNLTKTYGLINISMSTTFLTGAAAGASCNGQTPDQIMGAMATEGGGTFQALNANALKFNINVSSIVQPFTQRFFYVVNESRVVKNNTLYADSDRDGVSDADEMTAGTNPTNADPNNTGCSDGINAYLTPNAGLCAQTCAFSVNASNGNASLLADVDADSLHDCTEQALGSNHLKADSDGDNLVDALEVRFGTNFNDSGTLTADSDGDGVKDSDEILQGTNPLSAESNRDLAYVYAPLVPITSKASGTSCYNFDVTNVQLVQTLATANTNAGDNVICLYVEQLPQSTSAASSDPTVTKACFTANFQVQGSTQVKVPADGLIPVTSTGFAPSICNSASCK